MFGDVDHLHDLFQSTWRCCSFLRGWIGSLISKHCTDVTALQSRNYLSKLVKEREHQLSTFMSQTAYIDLSSSDSDLEEIEPVGRRTLPPSFSASASGSNSRSKDYADKSRKVPSPRRAHTSNGISPNYNHHRQVLDKFHPSSSGDIRASNRQVARADSSTYFSQNGNALKRTLPLSMQALNPAVDNRAHNQFRDITNKGFMRDHSIRGNDEHMYDRMPPFVKSSSNSQFPSSSEPQYLPGIGEERVADSDERLIYQAALEELNQPKLEATLPDGLLSVSLLRHQKIALAWMLQKETRSLHCLGGILADDQGLGKTISMIALIQMQRSLQSKSKPEHLDNKTEALNLDDDEDHGGCDLDKVNNTEESDLKSTPEASTSAQPFKKKRPAAGTLVVCPASVLRQWARELDEKVAEEAKLSVLVYHGGSRTRNPEELAGYDVVLTTYAIVTNEVPKQPLVDEDEGDEKNVEKYGLSSDFSVNKKRKKASIVSKKGKKGRKGFDTSPFDCGSGPLARVGWFRVILDEAQTIKNHRTQVARACCSLRAKRRWCLSGTPIQNAIDDLYSYFRFLKYDPYAVYKSFYTTIKVPISRNSLQGYKKLQAVLRAIMLRRTKGTMIDGQPIINLPPKTINLSKVEFSSEERAFYTKLEADSRSQFKAYAAAGTVNQNYANILLMLLRLRQACDHPLLVKGYDTDCVGKDSVAMASTLSREMLINLLNALESSEAICRVCNDVLENPVVTMCGHVFCHQCVSENMTGDDSMCPAIECKKQVGPDVVFSESTLISCLSKDLDGGSTNSQLIEKPVVVQNEYTSSKVRAVIEIIQSHCRLNSPNLEQYNSTGCNRDSSFENENPYSDINVVKRTTVVSNSPNDGPIKAIIFSQWTKMLDLVENAMNEYCIQYRRLDGTMTLTSRDRAVKEFNTDPEVTVMLMSLKAGNLGLNMVAACHVILLDLWWNPTTEDQAVDRAHRIGQTRPVTVTRLTIKDTVEDRILALQDEKRKMVASAFGEDNSGGSAARLTVEDLRYLFMV
ncbi:putative DNA helicase chromatin remodeling SNF2 family [Rosa chinensis]|uniref:Putative DNA helicase chromatin remodeling SNF2 family n=1 Tax=Rosa chinensis TaxID=74649 RepID=A0A2P6R4U2_ROSCH|nr:helicase-like transcription factor CHR28 isoform X1 [Rosa chinensis]XP_024193363.1 helicase-like transcription factor CHR28 isoform X1 [Rosa chinensis]XP_024193365.1 helicase-like transcription factor CHR28 isoform X1 [Rosa chinensis]XP_024193366.1 helicase-like transcription factor CHR28 isoform X1 [Rosa chinensis]XP_024193367.1 helicase-like transcription factor CHR28 isoform X1 [Rosa chinensis]XP_040374065.1 helicase-like transcription factor CHR28 isoform X1 [Rosa chinensis]PRQ41456.1 